MKDRFLRIAAYIRFQLDLYIFRNNTLFNVVTGLCLFLLLIGSWSLYVLLFLLLFRNWVIIRKYCRQIHDFPVFYISFPYTPFEKLAGISFIALIAFPLLYLVPIIFIHFVFYLSGIAAVPLSLRFYAVMFGNVFTWSSIMIFAALHWKSGQFRKLISVIFAVCTIIIITGFVYIRTRYSEYFTSLLSFSDLTGFIENITTAGGIVQADRGGGVLPVFLGIVYYFLLPLGIFRLSLRQLRRIEL